ncbi:MAG: hypothetical protein IJL78_10155 [Lachnospiraceae bacterium]|nr:hypothetical protein [Lachnospiraceae bacterium]
MFKRYLIFLFSLLFLLMTNCGYMTASKPAGEPEHKEYPEMHGKWVCSETKTTTNGHVVIWERADEFDSLGNPVLVTHFLDDNGEDYVISKRDYDSDGNIIRNEKYTKDGELDGISTFLYDSDGRQLEQCVYDVEGELTNKHSYKYDLEGKLIWEYQKIAGLVDGTTIDYTYDDHGNLIQKEKHYSDGSESVENWECRYEGDHLVWYAKLNDDGTASESDWTRYEYDNEGNIICTETPKNLKQYADGLLVYESNQSQNGSEELAEYVYEYDDEGHLIREQLVFNGNKIWCYIYTYNERGQKLKKIMAAPDSAPDALFDEKQIICEYTYDAYGNVLSLVQGEVRTETSWVFIENVN